MHFAKLSSIFEYTVSLLKQYQELHKKTQNVIYRIADIKQSTSNSVQIVIQLIGKSTFIECTPKEIAANDHFLEGFSKTDIRTITYYACQPEIKTQYKIIAQEIHNDKLVFKLKAFSDDKIILKSAGEILLDKNIINQLSREDAYSVSYTAGYEHSQD